MVLQQVFQPLVELLVQTAFELHRPYLVPA
jgi:hypothetical protein